VTSSETIGYGWALLKYMAQGSQTDTPGEWRPDSGRTTPTDTTHNGDAHWAISIGLSAVLWISIPAAASIVAPQRRKKKEKDPNLNTNPNPNPKPYPNPNPTPTLIITLNPNHSNRKFMFCGANCEIEIKLRLPGQRGRGSSSSGLDPRWPCLQPIGMDPRPRGSSHSVNLKYTWFHIFIMHYPKHMTESDTAALILFLLHIIFRK